jgi:hypothetical protein
MHRNQTNYWSAKTMKWITRERVKVDRVACPCCTFETLIQRFGILDKAVLRIAQLIHDADVEDDKFNRVEGFGVEQIFKGWAKQGLSDQEILSKGFECFDALYAQFKRS